MACSKHSQFFVVCCHGSLLDTVSLSTRVMHYIPAVGIANERHSPSHTEDDPSGFSHFINMIFFSLTAH